MAYHYKHESKEAVTIKLTKKRMVILLAAIALAIGIFIVAKYYPKAVITVDYNGVTLGFGEDLRQTKSIPVYPNESAINYLILTDKVALVTIAYKNTSIESTQQVTVNAFEIANKLKLVYLTFGVSPEFDTQSVDSFDDISSSEFHPYIVVVTPDIADGNYVKMDGSTVYISGMTKKDLYISMEKFIVAALNITV